MMQMLLMVMLIISSMLLQQIKKDAMVALDICVHKMAVQKFTGKKN